MQQIIQDELEKLQAELQTLDQAVKHIAKAEELATNVVQSAQGIHEQYKTHLNKVLESYKSYLEQVTTIHRDTLEESLEMLNTSIAHTNTEFQQNIQGFARQAQDIASAYGTKAQEIAAYLEHIPPLHETHLHDIRKLLADSVAQTQGDVRNSIRTFTDQALSITGSYETKAKETLRYFENIPALHETHLSKIRELLEQSAVSTQSQFNNSIENFTATATQILGTLDEKVAEARKALEGSSKLVAQMQLLFEHFDKIDVPLRLDKLDLAVSTVNQSVQNLGMRVETLERNALTIIQSFERSIKDEMYLMKAAIERSIKDEMYLMKAAIERNIKAEMDPMKAEIIKELHQKRGLFLK